MGRRIDYVTSGNYERPVQPALTVPHRSRNVPGTLGDEERAYQKSLEARGQLRLFGEEEPCP